MFKSAKISVILPALFGLTVLLIILQGGLGLRYVSQLESESGNIARRMERSLTISSLDGLMGDIRRYYLIMLAADTASERQSQLEQIQKKTQTRDTALEHYGASMTIAAAKEKFAGLRTAISEFDGLGANFVKAVEAGNMAEAKTLTAAMTKKGTQVGLTLDELVSDNTARGVEDRSRASNAASAAVTATVIGILVSVAIAAGAAFMSIVRVTRPISRITGAMNVLASGNNRVEIPYADRHDEIGEMAEAVAVFRTNALERERLEQETEANRSMSEKERIAREEQKAREAADVAFAVDNLGLGLQKLSDGDMTFRLAQPFADQLDQLRVNFNDSLTKLNGALRDVGENARLIDAGANEIHSAADDLAKRTEQQASSVEETAAALEEVTTAVKDSAIRASEAGKLVEQTHVSAEKSGDIVRQAVTAMEAIEASSSEIGNIIGVIDDIAFQTNLLALNAGVEAARAGEAGKGFAVVAQEVRELAQRSAKAALEIKALVKSSGDKVRDGVDLVGETGNALSAIAADVQKINANVGSIVVSSREQSTGLHEINTAVNQMDQGTQRNAAMVEQTNAASHSLAQQAGALMQLLAQFKLDEKGNNIRPATASSPAIASPARSMRTRLASALGGKATAAAAEQEWSEF
jgi:methyl-accepting chemotaxis protein